MYHVEYKTVKNFNIDNSYLFNNIKMAFIEMNIIYYQTYIIEIKLCEKNQINILCGKRDS